VRFLNNELLLHRRNRNTFKRRLASSTSMVQHIQPRRIASRRPIQITRNPVDPKPIYIAATSNVTNTELEAVVDGVKTLLNVIGAQDKVPVRNFGRWKEHNGKFGSADWYVQQNLTNQNKGRGLQAKALGILNLQELEPYQKQTPHYEVFVTGTDLSCPGLNFVIGMARTGFGTVLSTRRFKQLPKETLYECVKTETLHEFGHVVGAATGRQGVDIMTGRGGNNSTLYDNHCANDGCVMRQGVSVPNAWIQASNDRLRKGKPFCEPCVDDMKKSRRI
jgi:predicted Zn-dependent protease